MLGDPTVILDPVDWNRAAAPELGRTPILDWIECTCLLRSNCGNNEPINLRNMITIWEEAGLSLNPPSTRTSVANTAISGIEDDSNEDDDSNDSNDLQSDHVELLLEQFRDRSSILGSAYPFELSKDTATIRCIHNDFHTALYAHLLLLCAIEGYGRKNPFSNVTDKEHYTLRLFFESIVLHCLRNFGYDCAQIGTGAGSSNFFNRLQHTLQSLNLGIPNPRTKVRPGIKDGGADILAGHFWGDRRSREVVHIIQCTVSPPQKWSIKINEAAATHWYGLLNQECPGVPCLATPYETTDDARHEFSSWLMQTHSFIDRIRLTLAAQQLNLTKIPDYATYISIIKKALTATCRSKDIT